MHVRPSHFDMHFLHAVGNLFLLLFFFSFFAALLFSSFLIIEFVTLQLLFVTELNGVRFLQRVQLLYLSHSPAFNILTQVNES